MKRVCSFVLVLIASILCEVFPALAEETAFGHITTFQTGNRFGASIAVRPADDTVAVHLDVQFINSGTTTLTLTAVNRVPCANAAAEEYALDPKDSSLKLNESVLLSAYLAGKKVRLTLDGCVFDKPRIIAVGMTEVN
jgi:hypothetical protein